MKTKDVLRILGITRPTLTKYVKNGTIGVTELPNGRYDYNEQDVYKFLNIVVVKLLFMQEFLLINKRKIYKIRLIC